MIGRGADEYQPPGGRDWPPKIIDASPGNPFCFQRVKYTQRYFPGNIAGIQIHCVQSSPRRLLAGVMLTVPEAGKCAPLAPPEIGLGRACRLPFHFTDYPEVACIHEK